MNEQAPESLVEEVEEDDLDIPVTEDDEAEDGETDYPSTGGSAQDPETRVTP